MDEITTIVRLIQDVAIKNEDGSYSALPFENILWNYFTLQDAVDFARYAVETTIQTMRFKNVVETVGGDVDILDNNTPRDQMASKEAIVLIFVIYYDAKHQKDLHMFNFAKVY